MDKKFYAKLDKAFQMITDKTDDAEFAGQCVLEKISEILDENLSHTDKMKIYNCISDEMNHEFVSECEDEYNDEDEEENEEDDEEDE